jgi:uncharacterized protein YndB with AHSA1/START domain
MEPIIKEVTIQAPASVIWEAITNKAQMKEWYFDMAGFAPEVGNEFTFTGHNEGKTYLHLCKVTEVVEHKKIAYTWRYDDAPGNSLVTFELFEENGATRVKLTHTGIETFGTDPAYAKKNFVAGWNQIIGVSLPEYIQRKS